MVLGVPYPNPPTHYELSATHNRPLHNMHTAASSEWLSASYGSEAGHSPCARPLSVSRPATAPKQDDTCRHPVTTTLRLSCPKRGGEDPIPAHGSLSLSIISVALRGERAIQRLAPSLGLAQCVQPKHQPPARWRRGTGTRLPSQNCPPPQPISAIRPWSRSES